MPHPIARHPQVARAISDGFWVIAMGAIGCYAFFVALGAFRPDEVAGVSIAVGVLVLLWAGRAWRNARLAAHARDRRLAHARERRGF
jgi:membrane protein implicated in regulation of membrane protease activity